jgi:hypothetical protein
VHALVHDGLEGEALTRSYCRRKMAPDGLVEREFKKFNMCLNRGITASSSSGESE